MRPPTTLVLVVAALTSAATLRAEILVSPSVGATFGGQSDGTRLSYGGSVTFKGHEGILGLAIDFGHAPDFLGQAGIGNNSLTSLMANLALTTRGRLRLYASSGLGLIKVHARDLTGLFALDSNELGFDVGGGLQLLPGGPLGFQGELRYFRNLTNPGPGAELNLDLRGLDFVRATAGLVVRF